MTPEEFHNFVLSTVNDPKSFVETLNSTIKFLDLSRLLFLFQKCEGFAAYAQLLDKGLSSQEESTQAVLSLIPLLSAHTHLEVLEIALATLEKNREQIVHFAEDGWCAIDVIPKDEPEARIKEFAKFNTEYTKQQKLDDVKAMLDAKLD